MAYIGNDLQVAFPTYRNIDDISGSFNSSATSFPLRVNGVAPVPQPLNSQQCLISVGGVVQRPDDSGSEGFRLNGGNIIFASAPTTGADFFGIILAGADYVDAGGNFPSGTASVPSVTFNDDLDTGIFNSGANQISFATGGSERLRIDSAGQIESVSLGTAAAPAFSFTTDSNTGFYSPGADQVAISTNGTGRLFVDSSGRVGIGTSSPDSSLTITKDAAVGINIRSADANFSSLLFGCDTVSGFNFITSSTSGSGTLRPISFRMGASEAFRVDTSGRVGIGTTSVSERLEVNGAVRVTNESAGWGSGTEGGFLDYYAPASQVRFGHLNGASGSAKNVVCFTGGSEAFRVDSSRRLLVGTSSTSGVARTVIQGYVGDNNGLGLLQLQVGSTNPGFTLGRIDFTDSNSNAGARFLAERDGGTWTSGSSHPTRLVFSTCGDGASSPTEKMRITSQGALLTYVDNGGYDAYRFGSAAPAGTSITILAGFNSSAGISGGSMTGNLCFRVFSNGNVQNTNNSYGSISDAKLKENIVDAGSQWDDLKALQVRKYNFKEGQTHTQIGLVAQEVELVSPGLVTESPDRDAEGNDLGTVTKSVNYSVLYMKAVKALQEAMERIEQLEAEMAEVKAQLS